MFIGDVLDWVDDIVFVAVFEFEVCPVEAFERAYNIVGFFVFALSSE